MYKKELIHTPARGAKMDKIKTTTLSHPPETISSAECHANPRQHASLQTPAPWGAMSARNEAGRALLLSASTVLVAVFLTGCWAPSDDERRQQRNVGVGTDRRHRPASEFEGTTPESLVRMSKHSAGGMDARVRVSCATRCDRVSVMLIPLVGYFASARVRRMC